MMTRKHILILGILSTFLVGCDMSGIADLEVYKDEVLRRKSPPIEPLPEPEPYMPFTYSATAKRDPFQNQDTIIDRGGNEIVPVVPAPDLDRQKQYLERFDIGSFIMVGTIENDKEHYALLRGTTGVHRVRVGDYIGLNFGKVISINDFGMEVVETIPDGNDGWTARSYSLELKSQS